jgi:hypothetical protein
MGGHCDYSPRAPKNFAPPLLSRVISLLLVLQTAYGGNIRIPVRMFHFSCHFKMKPDMEELTIYSRVVNISTTYCNIKKVCILPYSIFMCFV